MKEGLHPEYYQATVTCNCGNTFVTAPPSRSCTWKYVPSAIRSIPVSRRLLRPADVLTSSTRSTAWERLRTKSGNRKTEFFREKKVEV